MATDAERGRIIRCTCSQIVVIGEGGSRLDLQTREPHVCVEARESNLPPPRAPDSETPSLGTECQLGPAPADGADRDAESEQGGGGQGTALATPHVPDPPAVEPGHAVLDALHEKFTKYVAFPSPEAADANVLWTAATHAQSAWEHASRLVLKSPLRQCGKTRDLEIIAETAHRPLRTANISSAALVRSIDEADPPTILLDEADTIFAKRRGEASERAEDIRGIINAGHSRGWPYVRWNASARQPEECATFAMAAIAAIGDLPDTIEDRAVVLPMRRRAPGEYVAPFRRRHALPELPRRARSARGLGGGSRRRIGRGPSRSACRGPSRRRLGAIVCGG